MFTPPFRRELRATTPVLGVLPPLVLLLQLGTTSTWAMPGIKKIPLRKGGEAAIALKPGIGNLVRASGYRLSVQSARRLVEERSALGRDQSPQKLWNQLKAGEPNHLQAAVKRAMKDGVPADVETTMHQVVSIKGASDLAHLLPSLNHAKPLSALDRDAAPSPVWEPTSETVSGSDLQQHIYELSWHEEVSQKMAKVLNFIASELPNYPVQGRDIAKSAGLAMFNVAKGEVAGIDGTNAAVDLSTAMGMITGLSVLRDSGPDLVRAAVESYAFWAVAEMMTQKTAR